MPSRRHPLSGALYVVTDDGTVEVSKDGARGRFRADGTWIEGALTHADPHLCLWLAGPRLPERARRTRAETAATAARAGAEVGS